MRKSDTLKHRANNVYLLRHPWESWIKVGIARNVTQRMASYVHAWGCDLPDAPVVLPEAAIFKIGFLDAYDMEFRILRDYAGDVVLNEWLKLTPRVTEMERLVKEADIHALRDLFGFRFREQEAVA